MHDHDTTSHIMSAFPSKLKGQQMRGPWVYFVPKEAICGPKHFGPIPRVHLIQNPSAPGQMVGVAPPLPSYLTNASFGNDGLLALLSLESRRLSYREFV
jgi:hypothetical protein